MVWDADKLLTHLALGEDSRVKFMEAGPTGSRVCEVRRERIANELTAFGNTVGGALIFSVSDAGEVRPMNRAMMDALETYVSEICADSTDPPLGFTTQRLALPDGAFALVVEVERSPLVHRSPGGYLSRQGSFRARVVSGSAAPPLSAAWSFRPARPGRGDRQRHGAQHAGIGARRSLHQLTHQAGRRDAARQDRAGAGRRQRRSPRNRRRSPALHRAP